MRLSKVMEAVENKAFPLIDKVKTVVDSHSEGIYHKVFCASLKGEYLVVYAQLLSRNVKPTEAGKILKELSLEEIRKKYNLV